MQNREAAEGSQDPCFLGRKGKSTTFKHVPRHRHVVRMSHLSPSHSWDLYAVTPFLPLWGRGSLKENSRGPRGHR